MSVPSGGTEGSFEVRLGVDVRRDLVERSDAGTAGRPRSAAVALALIAAVGLSACSAATSGGGESGGEGDAGEPVVIALQQDVSTLDPTKEYSANATGTYSNIFDTVTAISTDGELEGVLATEWEVTEESKVWEFTLRDGVKFSNGEPLTADDVVFTFETIKKDKTSPYAAAVATLTAVEKVDDTTVRFVHDSPRSDWGRLLNVFSIVPDEAYAEDPEAFATKPIGSGPYKVARWAVDTVMELSANEQYWGDAPAVERATFQIVPSVTSAVSALRAGDVDIVPTVPPEEIESLESAENIELETAETNRVAYLGMNLEDGPLSDNSFRQAIAAAVDREAMVTVLAGQAKPNGQPVTPATFGFDEDMPVPTRDLQAAKELVSESGYEGETITFTYPTDRTPWMTNLAQLIAGQIEEAGINVELAPVKYSSFLSDWFDAKKSLKGIYLHTYGPSGMDAATPIQEFLTNPTRTSYSNETVNQLTAEQLAEDDEAARADAISELFQAASEDAPYVWLFTELQTGGVSAEFDWAPRADTQVRVKEVTPAS
ncbi:MAG: hypothetical protein GEU93_11510 [Propionibacteriales bacterium]|nr:hypothetical protein [Propionibacteriales bacterium]